MNSKIKILAIDDNPDNLISLKAVIKESFHEATLFSSTSGTIGIELAKAEDPDVILLDIVMPGIDGYEVCRKLKDTPILRDIPVVFLTALKGDKESRILALECGGEAFLAKPIDETELTAQIRAMVKIKQANLEKRDENERLAALVEQRTLQLKQELEERKRTEKALKDSEERFQMLFNEAPLGYQSLDNEGFFIEVNKQWLNTLGYAREEVIGKWFGDFLSPDYKDGFRKRFPIFKAQGFIHSEFEMIHKNGSKLFIAFEGRIGYDPKGNFKQTHCILQDITQSKKAIDALKESEERFKHIFESANVGKSITMPTGEINVNQAFCDMLGYTRQELLNKKWQDITPAEDIPSVQETISPLLNGEKTDARFYKRYTRKDGSIIWADVSVTLLRDQQGNPLYFITTVIDINEQVKAENALLESEEITRTLLNGLPESTILIELEGTIIAANNSVAERLGKTVDELIGKNIYQTALPEVSERRRRYIQQVIETKQPVQFEDESFGEIIDNRIHPVFDLEGNVNRLAIIGIDVTDRKNAEDKLKQSYDLLNNLTAMVPGVVYQYRLYPNGHSAFPISSPGMYDIYEVTSDEVREDASPVFTRIHPDDYDFIVESINESAQNLTLYHSEFRVILPKQGLRWRMCDAKPERLEDGSTLWYGIITDITDRKHDEEKLRINEERLRYSLEAATDAIWEWDVCTSETYYSPRWYEIIGYQPHEIKMNSKEWVALAHPDDKDAALKTIYESIANGLPYEVEFRTKHANGQWIWCLVKGKVTEYDASGKPTRVSGTCSDITIRKQTEEALRESELKYRSLIENTSDVVFCVNEKGEYQFANQVFAATFGKTPDYFKGKNFWDIYPKEEADYRQATNIRVFETGMTQSIEVTVPLPDKTLYYIANANPIKNETGKVILNLTSAIDITERKSAEEKIRESETMLKNSQQLAKIGSFHYNALTDQAYWSDELFVLYGLEPEKKVMSRSAARSFLHPDDKTKGDEMIKKALETDQAVEVEYRIIRADGAVRDHFAITQITKDENNEMIAIDGTVQDITERKQAEEALKESEVQYRNLTNSGVALIWTAGTDKLCNYFNEPWMRFTGRTLEQELGNGWTEGVHPEDYDRCVQTYSWAFDRRESFEMEYRLRHASGEYRWLRDMGIPNYDSRGEFIGYIGHCFDITERKQIESELVRAKEKAETSEQFLKIKNEELISRNTFIQTILENLPIGVALNEITSGEATYMNKKFQEIYGWNSDEITSIGSFFEKVYPDEAYRNTLMEWIMSDIQSGDPSRMHWENITATRKDGTKRVINAVNIPLVEQNTMVSTVIDITDLNNIQEDLIAAKEKAEESDRLKSAFLANMSHEIRTPMNSIMGFASLLPDEESTELMANYAKIIVRSAEQLVHIIDDIVLYSRLQTKLLSYTPTPFNVHNLLTDVKQSFSLPEFQKGVELNIETTSELPVWISSDYEKLRQIFTNLISNAFKYTFSGSITIGCIQKEKELEFFVRDTGLGIPPNEVEKIFERFYRGSNVNKGVIGGTGLGLSIVKELIDLLGGKIWAESEEDKGTTFFFIIPV